MADAQERQWRCAACWDEHDTANHPPIYDTNGESYCVTCVEVQLQPIANGDDEAAAPKIGDTPLSDIPGALDRVDAGLRQRFEENLVCAWIVDVQWIFG